MVPAAWLGLLAGSALGGSFVTLFHHHVMRIARARKWLSRGAILVDVDPDGEFARRHPELAIHIPMQDLARRAHELRERERPIVVVANRWRHGAQAVHLLRGVGFAELLNAAGARSMDQFGSDLAAEYP
jgi:rhodanese-related sulfurtransferase